MRVGIYGGSFNPVHRGHTELARALCEAAIVEQIWLLVSPLNPLKRGEADGMADYAHRLRMAELAAKGEGWLRVSDFEARLPVPSYTSATLSALVHAFPETQFVLIVGEDNWRNFHRWHAADDIRARHDIVVYGRAGSSVSSMELSQQHACAAVDSASGGGTACAVSAATVAIHRPDGRSETLGGFPLYHISSTEIRQALREGNSDIPRRWLHPSVLDYILRNRLY